MTAALPCRVLVCFALPEEARFLPKDLKLQGIQVQVTGVGRANAVKSLDNSLKRFSPGLVLTCGFAGGLKPALALGAIVFSADTEAEVDAILLELGALPATFICSDRIAVRASEKAALWQKTGADVVEMESEPIRQCCRKQGIPSATIRVISDTAEEDLPLDFNALMTADLDLNTRKLAWTLLRSPQKVPALLQLQKNTKLAARELARVLMGLLKRKGVCTG